MELFRVLAVTVMAMAAVAAPALAQTSGGDPPGYALEEDGTVVIDGDGATDCRSFASFLEQGTSSRRRATPRSRLRVFWSSARRPVFYLPEAPPRAPRPPRRPRRPTGRAEGCPTPAAPLFRRCWASRAYWR